MDTTSAPGDNEIYELLLFLNGTGDPAVRAAEAVREICETYLKGRYRLDVVDVQRNLAAAIEHNILLTPTLLVFKPQPPVAVVGDIGQADKWIAALRLPRPGNSWS